MTGDRDAAPAPALGDETSWPGQLAGKPPLWYLAAGTGALFALAAAGVFAVLVALGMLVADAGSVASLANEGGDASAVDGAVAAITVVFPIVFLFAAAVGAPLGAVLGALNGALVRTPAGAGLPVQLAVGTTVGLLAGALLPGWLLDSADWGWLQALTAVSAGTACALHLRHTRRLDRRVRHPVTQ